MLEFIMDRNVLLYVLAAACAVGVVSQLILKQVYAGLIRDTRNTGAAAGRFLVQLRQRFQYCTHLNDKVGDVSSLIRRNLMEYRFWGLNLHQWKKTGLICLAISILCAFLGTIPLWHDGGELIRGNTYFWMGVLAAVLTAAAYGLSDTTYQREVLEVSLADYLQNSGAAKDYSESSMESTYEENAQTAAPIVSVAEGRRAKRRARAETAAAAAAQETRAQREKRELKENLARMKTGMQEAAAEHDRERDGRAELLRQMDPKDQERILKEVLKEFLNS